MRITYANNFNRNRNRKRVKKRTGNGKRQTIQIKRCEREQNSTKFYCLLFHIISLVVYDSFEIVFTWLKMNKGLNTQKQFLKFKLFIKILEIFLFNFRLKQLFFHQKLLRQYKATSALFNVTNNFNICVIITTIYLNFVYFYALHVSSSGKKVVVNALKQSTRHEINREDSIRHQQDGIDDI